MKAKINKIKKDIKNKVDTFSFNFRTRYLWFVTKWMSIGLIVFYIGLSTGIRLANDVFGVRVNYQVSVTYSGNGLLSPVLAK